MALLSFSYTELKQLVVFLNVGNLKTKSAGAILKLCTLCQSEYSVIIRTPGEFIYLILESVSFLLIFPQTNHFSSSDPAALCPSIYNTLLGKKYFSI